MDYSQFFLFLGVVLGVMVILDFLFSKFKKNWKLTTWEKEERGE